MTDSKGKRPGLVDRDRRLLLIGIACGLCQSKAGIAECAGHKEVDVQHRVTVVGIGEVAVLTVIFHARTHTAPHGLVHLRIDAIALRAQRCEVDIAARRRVLRGEDVIVHRIFIEVGVARVVRLVGKHLRELEHVVGVAALRSVSLVDIPVAVGL